MKAEVVGSGLLMLTQTLTLMLTQILTLMLTQFLTLMFTKILTLMLTQDVNTAMKAEVVGSGLLMGLLLVGRPVVEWASFLLMAH